MVRGAVGARLRRPARPSPDDFEAWAVGRYGRAAFSTLLDGYTDKLFGLAGPRCGRRLRATRSSGAPAVGSGDDRGLPADPGRRGPARRDRGRGGAGRRDGALRHRDRPARRRGRPRGRASNTPTARRALRPRRVDAAPAAARSAGCSTAPAPSSQRLAALRSRAVVLVYLRVRAAPRLPRAVGVRVRPAPPGGPGHQLRELPLPAGRAVRPPCRPSCGATAATPPGPRPTTRWSPSPPTSSASSGLVAPSAVIDHHVVRIPSAFPVLERGHRATVEAAEAHLAGIEGLTSTGRWGGFTNGGCTRTCWPGLRVGEHLGRHRRSARRSGPAWWGRARPRAARGSTGPRRGRSPRVVSRPGRCPGPSASRMPRRHVQARVAAAEPVAHVDAQRVDRAVQPERRAGGRPRGGDLAAPAAKSQG